MVGLGAALLVGGCGSLPGAARIPIAHPIDLAPAIGTATAAPPVGPGGAPLAPVTPTPTIALPWPSPWVPDARTKLHVPILTYHVIAPWDVARAYARPNLAIDPGAFDAQLQALHAAGWHAITVSALADAVTRGAAAPARTFVITIDDGHSDGFTYALPILKRYAFVATFYVVAGRVGERDNLSWAQVKALADAGMEIGDHTLRHEALTTLTTDAAIAQVDGAQARFLAATGAAPTTFAYPFGSLDPAVVKIVEHAGFHMAVTTAPGAAESWGTRLVVPRLEVGPSMSAAEVLAKVDAFR